MLIRFIINVDYLLSKNSKINSIYAKYGNNKNKKFNFKNYKKFDDFKK